MNALTILNRLNEEDLKKIENAPEDADILEMLKDAGLSDEEIETILHESLDNESAELNEEDLDAVAGGSLLTLLAKICYRVSHGKKGKVKSVKDGVVAVCDRNGNDCEDF